jgi:hypothetical protein
MLGTTSFTVPLSPTAAATQWQTRTSNARREILAYQAATDHLCRIGWSLLTINTTTAEPAAIATTIAQRFLNC